MGGLVSKNSNVAEKRRRWKSRHRKDAGCHRVDIDTGASAVVGISRGKMSLAPTSSRLQCYLNSAKARDVRPTRIPLAGFGRKRERLGAGAFRCPSCSEAQSSLIYVVPTLGNSVDKGGPRPGERDQVGMVMARRATGLSQSHTVTQLMRVVFLECFVGHLCLPPSNLCDLEEYACVFFLGE